MASELNMVFTLISCVHVKSCIIIAFLDSRFGSVRASTSVGQLRPSHFLLSKFCIFMRPWFSLVFVFFTGMNADGAKPKLWPTQCRALTVFIWAEILLWPAECPKCGTDEKWNMSAPPDSFAHIHCTQLGDHEDNEDDSDSSRKRRKPCNKRVT